MPYEVYIAFIPFCVINLVLKLMFNTKKTYIYLRIIYQTHSRETSLKCFYFKEVTQSSGFEFHVYLIIKRFRYLAL